MKTTVNVTVTKTAHPTISRVWNYTMKDSATGKCVYLTSLDERHYLVATDPGFVNCLTEKTGDRLLRRRTAFRRARALLAL